MPRLRPLWIAAAIVLVALALFVFRRGPGGIDVDVAPAARVAELRATATASGEIVATRYADIGSSVMGRVVWLPVAEGGRVTAGQVLARIDPVQAETQAAAAQAQVAALEAESRAAAGQLLAVRAGLEVAQARARESERALDRLRELRRQEIVAQAELDTIEAGAAAAAGQLAAARADVARAEQSAAAAGERVGQARAERTRARDVLAKTDVVSPIDGTITRLNVREGEMVVIGIQNQPGTTLMTVSDLGAINAEVRVAEADVLRLQLEQPASVTLEAMPDRAFAARVIEIGASALPQVGAAAAREFRVVLRVSDPDPRLRPGLTCDAGIVTAERRDVLAVPLQAVVLRTGPDGVEQRGVFVAENGTARFRPVTTGIIGGLDIEVTGIEEGTSIVIGPFQVVRDLEDGARIRPRGTGR
jgi:HlyD family secretion protein